MFVVRVEPGSIPTKFAVANPVLLIVAALVFDESHVADVVKSCKLLSEKVPVAKNCIEVFRVMPAIMGGGFSGVTRMETSCEGVTVSVAPVDVLPPRLAVITVVPSAFDVASPFEPAVLLTTATALFDELQVAVAVMSCFDASVKVPTALYCWIFPSGMLDDAGVTVIDVTTAAVTTQVDAGLDMTESNPAVTNVVPVLTLERRPRGPMTLSNVPTFVLDVVHVAKDVRF